MGGLYQVGCIRALNSLGYRLSECKNLCGVSVGSITAFFVACMYTDDNIVRISRMLPDIFNSSLHNRDATILIDLLASGCIVNSNKFKSSIIQMCKDVVSHDISCITFDDIFKMYGKTYICVATRNDGSPVYFSRHTHAHMKCIDAVMASISIPMVFTPYIYNSDKYYDGCLSDPCPIRVFPDCKRILYLRIVPQIYADKQVNVSTMAIPYAQSNCNFEQLKLNVDTIECKRNNQQVYSIDLKYKPESILYKLTCKDKDEYILNGYSQTLDYFC